MIQKLWLFPPLAFARLGRSETPCDNFHWGPNDIRPRGTGKTVIQPAETLHVAVDGTVTSSLPTEIILKDAAGFRPICPFFELHAEWSTQDGAVHSGPITQQVLALFGLTVHDLKWKVEVANLKPFHYTLVPDDRIVATVEVTGDVTERQLLRGISPPNAQQPLIPVGQFLPLGSVQLTRPTEAFPELRLRFTPATGRVYAPTDLNERLDNLRARLAKNNQESMWKKDFALPKECLILNPKAAWCGFDPNKSGDYRTNPGLLYADEDDTSVSLGFVDDVCDGVISCTLPGLPPTFARVTSGPPDYAPDRRPVTSIADGLTDRVRRSEVRDPAYVEDIARTTLEIRDLMERIFETMGMMNVDVQNARARGENASIAQQQGLPANVARDKAFPPMDPVLGRPLPLTELGRQQHRRFVSLEAFENILRENPDLLANVVREPMTGNKYYDQQMPALMRGSDRYPMHISRRQYDLLMAWVQRLRKGVEE